MFSPLAVSGFSHARQYVSVTSTMDVARDLLKHEPPTNSSWGAVITAEEQTAGRGRQGRAWLSSRGAFMATFIFASEAPVSMFAGYSLAVGAAVAEVLEGVGVRAKLKWPNDIVVLEGSDTLKKLGGILIEVQEVGDYRCILVGLGVNTIPPHRDVRDIAASIEELGVRSVTANDLLSPMANALRTMHERFVTSGGFTSFRQQWMDRSCFVVNETALAIDIGEGQVQEGTFAGVLDSGALVLDVSGSHQVILSGHITSVVLRPHVQQE